MSRIKLVVEIDEKRYKSICDIVEEAKRVHVPSLYAQKIIANGIPLPKGHGRLIDADKLHHCECKGNFSECDTCLDDNLCNLVNEAPTIIEADKEGKNKEI